MPATIIYGLGGAIGVGDVGLLAEARAASAVDLTAEDRLEEGLGLCLHQLAT